MKSPLIINPVQYVCGYYGIPLECVTITHFNLAEIQIGPQRIQVVKGSIQYSLGNGSLHEQHFTHLGVCPLCCRMCQAPQEIAGYLPCCGTIFCRRCLEQKTVQNCVNCRRPLCEAHAAHIPNEADEWVWIHPECVDHYQDLCAARDDWRRRTP